MEINEFNIKQLIERLIRHVLESDYQDKQQFVSEFRLAFERYSESIRKNKEIDSEEGYKQYLKFRLYFEANFDGFIFLLVVFEMMVLPNLFTQKASDLMSKIDDIDSIYIEERPILKGLKPNYTLDEFENLGFLMFGKQFKIEDFIT